MTASAAAPVVLYIQRGCAICHQVRRFLETNGIDAEIRWVDDPKHVEDVERISREHSIMAFPIVLVGDKVHTSARPDGLTAALEAAGHTLRPAASESSTEGAPVAVPAAALWVASFAGELIEFVDLGGPRRVAESVSIGSGSMPYAIGHDPDTDVVAVTDYSKHRVVFFSRSTGRLLRDTVDDSCLATGEQPGEVVCDRRRQRFYISSTEEGTILAVDSETGAYANGSREASTLQVGTNTNALAIDPVLDRLYLRAKGIIAIDLDRFELVSDGEWGTQEVLFGRDVRVDPETHLLYVPGYTGKDGEGKATHQLAYLDGRTGGWAFGDARSSCAETPASPWTVLPVPAAGVVLLACLGTNSVHAFEPGRPKTAESSAGVEVGAACRSMAVMPDQTTVAASSFDDALVTFIDARTNAYAHGTRSASTASVAAGPRGMLPIAPNG